MATDAHVKWMTDLSAYWTDTAQRTVLFLDILRKRGNIYLEHLRDGQPPVLVFQYETIMDGRSLDRPVNYALVRIIDRRREPVRGKGQPTTAAPAETLDRRHRTCVAAEAPRATSRPIVIFDPRAGHGPGIGGSKTDSQIGMALDAGHPVYFLIFFTRPMPGQTLADVRNAQIRFLETVRERHPDAPRPAIIGNCQGGWAAALVGAERPDLVGPMVFNGSPLSYWGGVEGVNPMRYLGGLMGGVWINSLLSDWATANSTGPIWWPISSTSTRPTPVDQALPRLCQCGHRGEAVSRLRKVVGRFLPHDRQGDPSDRRRPVRRQQARTRGVRTRTRPPGRPEKKRQPRGGLRLFRGQHHAAPAGLQLDRQDLRHRRGDQTPRPGDRVHRTLRIGHLGIFVSAKIARKEHKEIIASFDMLTYLPPGLYEMKIEEDPDKPGEYAVTTSKKTWTTSWPSTTASRTRRPFSRFAESPRRPTSSIAPLVRPGSARSTPRGRRNGCGSSTPCGFSAPSSPISTPQ
jgi:pimeloyl-ACP methyl ester carboxylesterase